MKLELNEHELDYLTMVIEQNMEEGVDECNEKDEVHTEMLKDLYSKLIVLTKTKAEDIIEMIQEREIDGETMQYILEQTGLDYQMYKQLNVEYNNKK